MSFQILQKSTLQKSHVKLKEKDYINKKTHLATEKKLYFIIP